MSNQPHTLPLPSQGTHKPSPGSFPLKHSVTLFAFGWFLGRDGAGSSLGFMRPLVGLRGKDQKGLDSLDTTINTV